MSQEQTEKTQWLIYAIPLVILTCFAVAYWTVFQKLLIRWEGGDNSYCYLIVPLFVYLLWDMRGKRDERFAVGGKEGSADGGIRLEDREFRSLEVNGRDQRSEIGGTTDDGRRSADDGSRGKTKGKEHRAEVSRLAAENANDPLKPQAKRSSNLTLPKAFYLGDFSWSIWGFGPIILSILLIIIGELGSVETLLYGGIWGCIAGVFVMLYGQRVRHLFFPLLILLFMVPLPAFINRMLTFKLKLAASSLSAALLRLTGVSVLREGNIIDLGVSQLQVVDACSGLRYLMPLILTALLVGYFFNKKLWQKAILMIVVVPLSIIVNTIRIWVTGMLTVTGYQELAQSFFHDFSGWLIYMIAGAILVLAALVLRKIGARSAKPQTSNLKPDTTEGAMPQSSSEAILKPNANQAGDWLKPALITLILCLLFAGSGWAIKAIPSAGNLPERMSFESFPMTIGKWQGSRHYLSKDILEGLWADDYVSATYKRPETANQINLLIPFYEYQGTRHTGHAPQSCMLGSGWSLFNSKDRLVNLDPDKRITIKTMVWGKGDYKLLGSYFFLQRGRVITNPWMNKFYLMKDAFTKRRTDGALVRVEMPIAPGQSVENAYKVLEGFIAELWPILPRYIPN